MSKKKDIKMTTPVGIGARIREVRGRRSQQEFADILDVSKGAISSYENERQIPGALFLYAVCDQFHVEPRWLLRGEGPIYDNKFVSSRSDEMRNNILMDEHENKIMSLEHELAIANERLKYTQEMYHDAKTTIIELKEELKIVRMEKDRTDTELIRATMREIQKHNPAFDIPFQSRSNEIAKSGHPDLAKSDDDGIADEKN